MTQANAILGLIAQTSIHAGTGSAVGAVDLPIQREAHNGWPCVYGASLKGAMRAAFEDDSGMDPDINNVIFGPNNDNGNEHAGALAVGDARTLLLPVRSLTSAFKWVTCGEALKRLCRDVKLLNITLADMISDFSAVNNLDSRESKALVANGGSNGDLFLEEYRFTTETKDLSEIVQCLSGFMERDEAAKELEKRLVIVSDNMFNYIAQYTLPVTARIAIDNASKTVMDGALWYEESLPPETLLYVPIMAQKSRRPASENNEVMQSGDVLNAVVDKIKKNPWLQLGGNATVGMGWCGVKIIQSGQ